MENTENRDAIIDIVLNCLYMRRGRFTIEEVENQVFKCFEDNNIDYSVYEGLIPNALVRLVEVGRFEIENKYFVYDGNDVTIKDEHYDDLIEIKNKIEKKRQKKLTKSFKEFKEE